MGKYTLDNETEKEMTEKIFGQKLTGFNMKQGETGNGILHLDFGNGKSLAIKWVHDYNPLTVKVIETKDIIIKK